MKQVGDHEAIYLDDRAMFVESKDHTAMRTRPNAGASAIS